MNNCRSSIVTAAVVAGALALLQASAAMAADTDKTERTVSVAATGSVTAVPDIAYVAVGVVSEADSAKAAIASNTAVMNKVIDGLKAAGIAAQDMQTTHLNVQPRYTEAEKGKPAVIDGYRVSNEVRLTVRDTKRTGAIIDQAIALGANQIGEISFDVADSEKLKDEARARAMENARRRGELYAKAAGAQLGPVLRISEGVFNVRPRTTFTRHSRTARIEVGTRRLDVEVNVVYALR